MQQSGKSPPQGIQTGADNGTEQPEIAQPTEGQPRRQMQPHPPLLQHRSSEKQHPQRRQPKEHVEDFPAPAHRQGVPHEPQQVIEQPQQQSRRKAEEKREGLTLWGEVHPRNRRLNRPGWRVSSSS